MKFYKDDFIPNKSGITKGNYLSNHPNYPSTPTSSTQITRSSKAETPITKETYSNPNINILTREESFHRNSSVNTVSSVVSNQKSMGDFARKNIDDDVVKYLIIFRN